MSNSISKDGNYKLESGSLYVKNKGDNEVTYWEPIYETMATKVSDAIDEYSDYLLNIED